MAKHHKLVVKGGGMSHKKGKGKKGKGKKSRKHSRRKR